MAGEPALTEGVFALSAAVLAAERAALRIQNYGVESATEVTHSGRGTPEPNRISRRSIG